MLALARIAAALERIAAAHEARTAAAVDAAVADEIRRRIALAEPPRRTETAQALGAPLDVDGWRLTHDRRAPERVDLIMFGAHGVQHAFTMDRETFVELIEKAAAAGILRGGAVR